MEQKVNERYIEIKKCKFPINKFLDYKEYSIALIVSIDDIARPDLQRGDKIKDSKSGKEKDVMFVDVIYKAKATGPLIIKDEFDKIYIQSDKKSQSQLLALQILQMDHPPNMTHEEYRQWFMTKLRHYCHLLPDQFAKWDKEDL